MTIGKVILEELAVRGWSNQDLAQRMGVPEDVVTRITLDQLQLDADLCEKLGRAFDVSLEFFARLQNPGSEER